MKTVSDNETQYLDDENERQQDAIKDVLSSSNDSLRLLAVELFIPRPESYEFWGRYNVFVAVRDELEKLKEDNKQLHRQYVGQRTAARVNWDKVKALEAELAALEEPWIRIDPADPETLPENTNKNLMLSIRIKESGKEPQNIVTKAWYINGGWGVNDPDTGFIEPLEEVASKKKMVATPYAWQPWPDAAPYPEE